MNKIKNIVTTVVFAAVILCVSIICVIKPADTYSKSERRPLAKMPEFNAETMLNGSFMTDFEKYTTDQFPMRDSLRTVKALFATKVLNKSDNNGLFVSNGHISKLDEKMDSAMINYASSLFNRLVTSYMTDNNSNVYLSVIPDKNMFLSELSQYPSMDYEHFADTMKEKTGFMEYIDIIPYLSLDDYYTTDTHWRQEKIIDIAEHLIDKMGGSLNSEYVINELDIPFYGVYYGQSALPYKADRMYYLTNDVINSFNTLYYGTGNGIEGNVYNMDKAHGNDSYEMFLSGSEPLIKIENSSGKKEKLIIFRDSFSSSLAPLLAQGYKETVIVDIRYMQSSALGNYVDFSNSDVLFIYSTSVLNTATSMK